MPISIDQFINALKAMTKDTKEFNVIEQYLQELPHRINTLLNIADFLERFSPLGVAIVTQNISLVLKLLELGADINKPCYQELGKNEIKPLSFACRGRYRPLVDALLSSPQTLTSASILEAFLHNSCDQLDYLVNNTRLDINTVDENGNSALHLIDINNFHITPMVGFFYNGYDSSSVPKLQKLIELNISVNTQNNKGETALHILLSTPDESKDLIHIEDAYELIFLTGEFDLSLKNKEGKTAYECIRSSALRKLFDRHYPHRIMYDLRQSKDSFFHYVPKNIVEAISPYVVGPNYLHPIETKAQILAARRLKKL